MPKLIMDPSHVRVYGAHMDSMWISRKVYVRLAVAGSPFRHGVATFQPFRLRHAREFAVAADGRRNQAPRWCSDRAVRACTSSRVHATADRWGRQPTLQASRVQPACESLGRTRVGRYEWVTWALEDSSVHLCWCGACGEDVRKHHQAISIICMS